MMTFREAVQQLEALYAQVPSVACQGYCAEACGPLGMSHLEWIRVKRATPLRAAEGKHMACPLLKRGRCTVYPVRPLICRLWGSVENMPCPWQCRPERYLTMAEADALMAAAEALSQDLYPGQEPKTMHTRELIEQRQEEGALAVAWAVLATQWRQ
jgi:Fe-S-cluster containining protein